MKHIKELIEKVKNLPADEIAEFIKEMKHQGVMTLDGCPKGYVKDSNGNCVPDLGNP